MENFNQILFQKSKQEDTYQSVNQYLLRKDNSCLHIQCHGLWEDCTHIWEEQGMIDIQSQDPGPQWPKENDVKLLLWKIKLTFIEVSLCSMINLISSMTDSFLISCKRNTISKFNQANYNFNSINVMPYKWLLFLYFDGWKNKRIQINKKNKRITMAGHVIQMRKDRIPKNMLHTKRERKNQEEQPEPDG